VNVVATAYPGYPTIPVGPAGSLASPLHGLVPVAYQNISIKPARITVKAGSTVKWTNFDATLHNVTFTSGPVKSSSPALNKGSTYKVTFAKPGVYRYICTFHPGLMIGTITVVH
jgi:plastocyanin